jgi:hypothetical protein
MLVILYLLVILSWLILDDKGFFKDFLLYGYLCSNFSGRWRISLEEEDSKSDATFLGHFLKTKDHFTATMTVN